MAKHHFLSVAYAILVALGGPIWLASAGEESAYQATVSSPDGSLPRGYVPPVLGNGSLCLQVDYQGCQVQRPYAKMIPGILWAGRRYGVPGALLVPFGRFEQVLSFAGQTYKEPSSWTQTLNAKEGLTAGECEYGDRLTVETTAFVHLDKNMVAIRKRFLSKDQAAQTVRMEFKYQFSPPGDANIPPRRMKMRPKCNADSASIDIPFQLDGHRECEGAVSLLADGPVKARIGKASFILTADLAVDAAHPKEIMFYLLFADSLDGKDYPARLTQMKSQVETQRFAGLLESHRQAWARYWDESYVRLPDVRMERAYNISQYHLRTNATQWSFPVALFNTHWAGKFFGWDETFIHLAMASSNHLAISQRVPDFRYATLNKAVERVSHYGRRKSYGARYAWESLEEGSEGSPPGYWIDHVFHMANIAVSSWYQYLYTGDLEYLKITSYPVIKECAAFYVNYMIYDAPDGGLIIGKCTDLERLGPAKINPFLTSCGVIFTLETAAQAAGLLGVDEDLAASWKETAAKLRQSLPHDGERYIPYAGCEEASIAVLGGIFPYPVIDASNELQKNAVYGFVREGVRSGNMYHVGASICAWYNAWMATALASLGDKDEPARLLSNTVDGSGCFSEIFEINEEKVVMRPWFSTAEGNVVYALNQMLLQCREGEILIAPAVPDEWKEFGFKLACFGNLVATASVENGRLVELALIPGDPGKTVKRTLVIPQRLVDGDSINGDLVRSMTVKDGCCRLDVEFKGRRSLLGGQR